MARPRAFDEARACAALMAAFHRDGYAATSLADLEAATGLGRRSLYNAFGDKDAMFVRALRDFQAHAAAHFLAPMETGHRGLSDVAETLNRLVDSAADGSGRLGCLICNTAREPVARDAPVAAEVERYFARIRAAFHTALTRAAGTGELPSGTDIEAQANALLGTLVSISVLGRADAAVAVLADIANTALAALGHPPIAARVASPSP